MHWGIAGFEILSTRSGQEVDQLTTQTVYNVGRIY